MRSHLLRLSICLLMFSLATESEVAADLTKTCFFTDVASGTGYGTADPSVPWFPSSGVVDVYYSTANNGYDYRPWIAVGLSEAQFVAATLKSISIWNEQSGARLRLRYKGPLNTTVQTCDQSLNQQCAIVIIGEPMNDDLACAGTVNVADAFVALNSSHKFQQGMIRFYRRNDAGLGCHVLTWTGDTSGYGLDVVRTLTHELGHAAYAMGHQNVSDSTSDCTMFTPNNNTILSVMNIPFSTGDGRSLKAWDKEVAQLRYGSRASTAQMFKSHMSTSTSWIGGALQLTNPIHPLHRSMSMAQGPSAQMFPWIEAQGVVNAYGAGAAYTGRYGGGFAANTILFQLNSPTAIASTTVSSGGTLLFAYKRPSSTVDYYSTDQELICWRTSTNSGSSWSSETCASSVLSANFGITAAYNQSANVFVIPYVDATGYGFNMKLLLVSTIGTQIGTPVSLGLKSGMQPAIACKQNTNTCLLLYAADNVSGSMSWVTLTINTSTYGVTQSTVSSSTVNVETTPGLAYDLDTGAYRLARVDKASAIFSYIQNWLGSWSGTGDIYNNSGGATQISGAALGSRYRSPQTTRPYAWFVKYF
jgi:hypothetical protein